MKWFKTWQEAYEAQNSSKYDNGMSFSPDSGDQLLDELPYRIAGVVWMVMAPDFYLHDYEESATEYGMSEDGRWAAVYDSHCSCNGWEAKPDDVTFYDSLDQLLAADPKAAVILEKADLLRKVYGFIELPGEKKPAVRPKGRIAAMHGNVH